jgi:creatinine amidohydrolase
MSARSPFDLGTLTTRALAERLASATPLAALVPVGAVEPHGPHLALETDTAISRASCVRAAEMLSRRGVGALIAPPVPYGVTNSAAAFAGAVSIEASALTAYLRSLIEGLLATGFSHVCLVNNHLEPGQDRAVRAALEGVEESRASVACPLTPRWGRTLSTEFKSGACHAGEYETAIVMAFDPSLVDESARVKLPEVPVSLSEKINEGVEDFAGMGLENAYAGAPARATTAHGQEMIERLAGMVATTVCEAMGVENGRDG